MFTTNKITKRQAAAISQYIVKTQSDGMFAFNSKYSATSTRITFVYNKETEIARVYSTYLNDDNLVLKELPKKYQKFFI